MKKIRKFAMVILVLFVVIMMSLLAGKELLKHPNTAPTKTTSSGDSLPVKREGLVTVHFIDVGQGDCILITQEGHSALIDTGGNNMGTKIQKYLYDYGITSLDYLVVTHPDEDHCGSADVIITKFDVDKILTSAAENNTVTVRDMKDAIIYKETPVEYPDTGTKYALGDATLKVLSPENNTNGAFADTNESSLCIELTYRDNTFLFSGDMTEKEEDFILSTAGRLDVDVYKVSHHGSANGANSKKFFSAIHPNACIISCGEGNSYGHPHKETMDIIKSIGSDLYRTDLQGTIIATGDGTEVTFKQSVCTDYRSGEELSNFESFEDEPYQEDDSYLAPLGTSFVLNNNTMKYHKVDCPHVQDLSERNREASILTQDELEALGYTPCKSCIIE